MSLTEIQLLQVAEQLGAEWESLAIHLGFTPSQIYQLKPDNAEAIVNAIHRMLCGWLYRQPAGSDFKGRLASGLQLCGRQDLADLVKTGVQTSAFDVEMCQRQLREHYLQIMCKVPQYPGDTETCIDMDGIYTNLSILYEMTKPCVPIKIPLLSHNEIFTREVNGMLPNRILVLGRGGSGKSTLLAKIAYDWATRDADSPLKDLLLLFVLNMRGMQPDTNLEDAILNQLLPKDTTISKQSLLFYMEHNPSQFMILLDSYDEFSRGERLSNSGSGTVLQLLSNNFLTSCRTLVTLRHWRASDFYDLQTLYAKIEIDGFSKENVREYVMKYFYDNERSGQRLCEYIEVHDLFGIASFPLMSQLLCLLWTKRKEIPKKIGELYTAIFQLLYDHFKSKGMSSNRISLNEMIVQLGEAAFLGLWPPENRLVFSRTELVEIASVQCVEDGCKAGIISQEKVQSTGRNPEKSISFFHKSGQEKCAGNYMAHLGETNVEALMMKLEALDSVTTCLSVQMVLRFASGASQKVALIILEKLIDVFKSELAVDALEYYRDNVEDVEKAKIIQEFIELCLICNYESGSTGQCSSLLSELFPSRRLQFMGLSPYTSEAAGFLMSDTDFRNVITEIKIIKLPEYGFAPSLGVSSIVDKVYRSAQISLQTKSREEVYNLHSQYIERQKNKLLISHFTTLVKSDYSYGLSCIELWEYFKTWHSTSSEINLNPIVDAVQYTDLEQLDLTDVHLGDQGEKVVSTITQGHLSSLTQLKLGDTALRIEQMNCLLVSLQIKLPKLRVLDISQNYAKTGHILDSLSQSFSTLSLVELKVWNMFAPAEDMSALAQKLPDIGSHLQVFHAFGNFMDNTTGMSLIDSLQCLHRLRELWIDIDGVNAKVHKNILMTLGKLTQLRSLGLNLSLYPDDLILYTSKIMPSLVNLTRIYLDSDQGNDQELHEGTSQSPLKSKVLSFLRNVKKFHAPSGNTSQEVSRSSWKSFMSSLQLMNSQIKQLYLINIKLYDADLRNLLDFWTENHNLWLGYTRNLWPDELEIPQNERLDLR